MAELRLVRVQSRPAAKSLDTLDALAVEEVWFVHRYARKVKTHTSPVIKVYLLRGVFYVVLLLAMCAAHSAVGQRYVSGSGGAEATGQLPTISGDGGEQPIGPVATATVTPMASPTATCSICFSPTPTSTPTASPTATATASPPSCVGQYVITQIAGSIVPGRTDIGNHSNELVTTIQLPFSFTLYGTTFTSVNLSSNGNAQFTTTAVSGINVCLPWSGHNATIYPYWSDLRTDAQPGCSSYPGGTCGIYTSVSGSAPDRIFNIEWRTVYWDPISQTQRANFELRLYEGESRLDVIYGEVYYGNIRATAGTQRDDGCFNQYFCNAIGGLASGGWTLVPVGTPSPTPTASPTLTPTATATASLTPTPTPTPCTGRCEPMPRVRPSPAPRP